MGGPVLGSGYPESDEENHGWQERHPGSVDCPLAPAWLLQGAPESPEPSTCPV